MWWMSFGQAGAPCTRTDQQWPICWPVLRGDGGGAGASCEPVQKP